MSQEKHSDTPMYDAVKSEQNFDPASVRTDFDLDRQTRKNEHSKWYDEALKKSLAARKTRKDSHANRIPAPPAPRTPTEEE